MKQSKLVKWLFVIFIGGSIFLSKSAMADMMDLYSQAILPSIVGSTKGKIPNIPTNLGFEKPQSLTK